MLSPKLAPELRAILEEMAAHGGPPLETLSAEEARLASAGLAGFAGTPEPVGHVEDRRIPTRSGDVGVRIYVPEGSGPFPGVVYLHGGGWVLCDLNSHDNICRAISNRANAVIVSVDYRRSPESKFPAAIEDCQDATRWVASNAAALHIDPLRLAIAGDSAGANMATVVATKARDENGPALALQVLIYPAVDLTSSDTPSHQEFATDHFLTRSVMQWMVDNYIDESERTNPAASPALNPDLRGLAPALVITAECDPLRDEGEAYAIRMQEAGVPVTLARYAGMIHPFLTFLSVCPGAHKALDQIADAVRSMSPAKPAGA